MTYIQSKKRALVLATPFEGRMSYFLAGLSFYYDLDIYFAPSKRFKYALQSFYRWQYDSGVRYYSYSKLSDLLSIKNKYDTVFVNIDTLRCFFGWYESQDQIIEFLKKIKIISEKLYWLELGEQQYFSSGTSEFWDLIDGVVKGQVFKNEYSYILRDPQRIALFQDKVISNFPRIVEENRFFNFQKYKHKIIPFPFTPSFTDAKDYTWVNRKKVYDIAANTRTFGNGILRAAVIRSIQERLPRRYSYSFGYDERDLERYVPQGDLPRDIYLIKKARLGEIFFRLKYGKYFYPRSYYYHNLIQSRTYLGLGWTFSSLRTADVWGSGAVLINFSFAKCDYGIPVEDGYNYVSIGERDELTDDNEHLKPEYVPQIMDKVEHILSDRNLQTQIIKNQLDTFREYFESPQQFVKKIFIDKVN